MRQKSRVIYDTQTEGATAINMCRELFRPTGPVCWWAAKFVDWKDCFHISAIAQLHAYIAQTAVTLMEELCL